LVGAWFANREIQLFLHEKSAKDIERGKYISRTGSALLFNELFTIAIIVLIAALILAFFFTYLRSKKTGTPLWGSTSKRLMVNMAIPLIVGGLFIMEMLKLEYYVLIPSACLIFYGLALVNASKYTLGEVRYLGYGQLILGLINIWYPEYGLYFWAAGFGVLHIVYGLLMWYKYEKE
jgi:E3 ubiquitin-protein ligase DOA10